MSDFAGNSAKLAIESIHNSQLRQHYIEVAESTAETIFQESKNAEVLSPCQRLDVWKGAAKKASNLRNILMEETRGKISPTALAFSKLLKNKAPKFSDIIAKYSYRIYGECEDIESFPNITKARQIRVFQEIVKASGRTNNRINIVSKVIAYFSVVSLIFTFAFILNGTMISDNPVTYTVHCVVTFKLGLSGAYLGSKLGSTSGCYLGLKNIYVFVLSICGGLCFGTAFAIVGDISVTFVTTHFYDKI